MNNQKFIEQQKERIENGIPLAKRYDGVRYYNSLMATDNVIYSYGRHYPLLWQVTTKNGDKVWCRNVAGYSVSTSKHIGLCSSDIEVKLPDTRYTGHHREEDLQYYGYIASYITDTLVSLSDTMNSKKRKDTKVYAWLKHDHDLYSAYKDILVV